MTTVLPHPSTVGRHRAPESSDEPRWTTPAEFRAAWMRIGRHSTADPGLHPSADRDLDPFDWLGVASAVG